MINTSRSNHTSPFLSLHVFKPSALILSYFILLPLGGLQLINIGPSISLSLFLFSNVLLTSLFILFYTKDRLTNSFTVQPLLLPQITINCCLLLLSCLALKHSFNIRYIISHLIVLNYILILSNYLTGEAFLRAAFKAGFLGGAILSLIDLSALLGFIEGSKHTDIFDLGYAGQGLKMTFSNHGAALSLGIMSGCVLYFTTQHRFKRILISLSTALMILMIITAQSRSGIVSCATALSMIALYATLYIWRPQTIPKTILCAVILTTLLSAAILLNDPLVDLRVHTVTERFLTNSDAFQTIRQHPQGIGWSTWFKSHSPIRIHNMFLNYGVALGFTGLLLSCSLIALAGWLFYQGHKKIKTPPTIYLYGSTGIFLSGLIEALFAVQTPSDWINIGLLLMACSIVYQRNKENHSKQPFLPHSRNTL